MTHRGVVIALWCAFAFVAWNIIYDQLVWTAATEFTREQVVQYQAGRPVTSIHDGFSPRVGDAAWRASLWTLPIVAAGAVAVYFSFRRVR
jgi:hypothetical protein